MPTELHAWIEERAAKHQGVERLAKLFTMANRVADAQNTLRISAHDVAINPNLSPDGKRAAIREHLGKVTTKYLGNAKKIAASFREDLQSWESRLDPAPADPKDAAAAAVRSEIRGAVRAMPPALQIAYIGRSDLPREVFSALLEGPSMLTGLSDAQRTDVLRGYRQTFHASDLAQIDQGKEGLAVLDAVISTVENEAARAIGIQPHELANLQGDK